MRSVSSSSIRPSLTRASPSLSSTWATASTKPTDWNCTVERFTATGATARPSACQRVAQIAASLSAHWPIGSIRRCASATGTNSSGMHQPTLRVVPAQQGLRAHQHAVARTHLRLEVKLELAPFQRVR